MIRGVFIWNPWSNWQRHEEQYMPNILDRIQSPKDLKQLTIKELEILAEEIRTLMVQVVSENGGHLAPNLGAVELTLAYHYIFDAPEDKIVWDVGHQAYVHKIITGRKDRFHTLRQYEGISGFPKISESEYDDFGVGHSSTSISAAFGLAVARDLKGEDYRVTAVIGDGALTGGLAFEGMNNAGASRRNFIVILNDNCMSISPNVGALSRYLTQIIATPLYNRLKKDVWDLTGRLPVGTNRIRKYVQRMLEGIKAMLVPGILFEKLGFRYFGPVDGHNLRQLIKIFQEIRKFRGPILVHLVTTKGKGYKFAEEDATKFHGLGSFCPETGNSKPKKVASYTEAFGKIVADLAEKDERIVGITAAMSTGTGLAYFSNKFPARFFDVGIAEGHAVTFAAGLAAQGFRPIVAIYSTFLQRAYDMVIHDVALQNLPIIFALDRAGLVGEDGPTHHGSFDLSYLRVIPNMLIMSPKDEHEMQDMFYTALQYDKGPVAIRYPRGECIGLEPREAFFKIEIGKSEIVRKGRDLAILTIGDRVYPAITLAERLHRDHDLDPTVVNMRFVKPLDTARIHDLLKHYEALITIENNSIVGGFGSAVSEVIAEADTFIRFKRFGIPDRFVTHGALCDLYKDIGLDFAAMIDEIVKLVPKQKRSFFKKNIHA